MNSIALILTRLPRRSSEKPRSVTLLALLALASIGHADVGSDNPSGPAGIFNGEALGYDPYTGNVKRSVTDISIAGAVSPLALTRVYNSRDPTGAHFGANGWRHSYEWTIDPSGNLPGSNTQPVAYVVNFPDGRRETFKFVDWDCGGNPWTCYYRVQGWQGGVQSSAGVRERFQQLDVNNLICYLILPDGGKVKFQATRHNAGNNLYYYTYQATAIIDPYGLATTLTYETTGSKRLLHVQEPAGRYIDFFYQPNGSQLIHHITGSDGRSVYYYYITSAYFPGTTQYMELNQVAYFNQWNALYKYCVPNDANGINGIPLLFTADDPMYPGPLKRIAYEYKTGNNLDQSPAAYGQIYKVRYWDGTTQNAGTGVAVSTLDVTATNTRKETRGDSKWRTFTYGTPNTNMSGYLVSCTDFLNHSASQTYDPKQYINSVTDRNIHKTDYTLDGLTGNMTVTTFPLTTSDTLNQSVRPTVNYSYVGANCNQDTNNPYWVCSATDEGGNVTSFWRDTNHRVTRINYPDGGYETFSYDAAHFYQISTHRMKTGGTESFAYDGLHRLQYYSDPYHNNTNNPSITFYYDALHRVSGIADALNHSTNFEYNDRGQITLTTLPWTNGHRYTISNLYYPDGTLQKRTDELGHFTTFTYDDYRRLKSVTPPARNGTHTTQFYYGANSWDNVSDYQLIDSNITWVVPPSSTFRKIQTVYDDNRRKITVTVAPTTADEATTSYAYDNSGNVTWVTNPLNHNNVHTLFDERNRPYSISVGSHTSTIWYDTAGRTKEIDRPNGQVITYDSFDAMSRVTQQTASQTPDPDAVTTYTYYTTADGANAPVGLLKTMKDPHLVQLNNGQGYTYEYDLLGRKKKISYPKDSTNTNRTEQWAYDTVGRLETFTNRANKVQTFGYDQLNRMTGFTWNDGGVTPSVSFGYDEASRLIEIDNANARISRTYYNDNLLHMETQSLSVSGGLDNRNVTYTYDDDGNRASLSIPGYTFDYVYTNRNQLKQINDDATGLSQAYYEYNTRGNLTLRNVYTSPVTVSNYSYDLYDRPTWITHTLNNTSRSFNYGYYDDSNNREFVRRLGSSLGDVGDVFRYDRADQAISVQLDVATPQNMDGASLPQRVFYDPNGNRTTFTAADTYAPTNNLNQYTNRTINNHTYNAGYDITGSLTVSPEATSLGCTYDAQNRLIQASKNGATMNFKYDGLNRQVRRTVSGTTTYSTWDGWDLVEEYTNNPLTIQARYLYGPTGLVKELQNNRYYCQDGSGSTSHLLDSTGHLLEWYRYDLQGTPIVNDQPTNHTSAFNVRHLFTGQQWYQEIGLYDLRNRFYSPDLGRFLQPDPIGFWGGRNLYRYCGNNPVTRWDPFGLQSTPLKPNEGNGQDGVWVERVTVIGEPIDPGGTGAPSGGGGGGGSGEAGGGRGAGPLNGITFSYGVPPRNDNSNTQQQARRQNASTLANSPATILLGKFLQSFNSQGGWNETATALDAFAGFEASLLLFGEGQIEWGVGRYVLGPIGRATFWRGTTQSTVLQKPMTVFRYWGGRSEQVGPYFTTADTVAQISSPNAASVALALPEGNTAATLTQFTIPAGTRVYVGGVAGGADTATQVYVLNPGVVVIGAP